MTTAMMSTHFAPQQHAHYGYAPPPSPPMEDTSKCSLPSISNLLGLADQGSPTSETSPQSQQSQSSKPDTRPNSSHYGNSMLRGSILPPSPPMTSDNSFEGYNSPATKPMTQLSTAQGYYFESPPPLSQIDENSRHIATAVPRAPVHASAYQSQFAAQTYMSQPAMPSYYPPMQPAPPQQQQMPGMFFQRPLPQVCHPMGSFPTRCFSSGSQSYNTMPVVALGPPNSWQQHHHFIAPSSASSFPQSQDRYICQTCNKAFSRPSSLRIHSHSHTGEKPFKCAHAGCGKAFSVRSNMKRHERGCHSFESSSGGPAPLS
ncbi:hypothetical protein B0H63DRAFT_285672 [Podospora didyma]|uniref:C2H2-type domain-containing protein n=1 Tax=Podospora didyma TaxID=330526 RepID=A0AAE0N6I9_9PEZI|nr:hypothetical protein B0H63DRAFT_285672 [Podospora didyma]